MNVSSSVIETIWCSLTTVQRLQRLVWRLRSALVDGPRGIFETFRWNVVVSCGKQTSSGPNITHLSQNVLPFLPSFPPVLSALARYCVIAGLSSERSRRAGAKIRTLPSPVRHAPGSEDRFCLGFVPRLQLKPNERCCNVVVTLRKYSGRNMWK